MDDRPDQVLAQLTPGMFAYPRPAAALVVAGVIAIEGCATMAKPVPEPPPDLAQPVESYPPLRGFCPEPVHGPVATYDVDSLRAREALPDAAPPVATYRAPMSYPDPAREAHVQGVVVLAALVCEHGRVVEIRRVKSIPQLDEAAIAALRKWRFDPKVVNGTPVSAWVSVPFRFSLQ